MADPAKRPAAEDATEVPIRRKKKRDGRTGNQENLEVNPADFVRVVPFKRSSADAEERHGPVQLSKSDKAAQLQLSDDRLSVTGHKGYRSVRATHGCHEGTWYCEVAVTHLGASGHVRLGWSSKKADINAPVGFDAHGVAYRDLEGSKVHKALREPYGAVYKEGDVVGLLLHMPSGGKSLDGGEQQVVRYKGALYTVEEDKGEPQVLPGSLVGFSLNGVYQGAALIDLLEGTYYPTASLFTLPDQAEGATVTFNFGPAFKFPPPSLEALPVPRALCEASGSGTLLEAPLPTSTTAAQTGVGDAPAAGGEAAPATAASAEVGIAASTAAPS